MLNAKTLENAKSAYASKDYEEALRGYYDCLKQSGGQFEEGEAGLLYHMLGNCLMKMHNYQDATEAYEKALADEGYESLTSVHSNLGLALSNTGDYKGAISHYEQVLKDPNYKTPYKTYNGLGNAYMQLGDFASAGTAYRNAAVDASNPQPVKSLLNLGVCFMGLDRPADAIETYKAIFEFNPDAQTINKTYANMGQAYVGMGEMDKARECFEKATHDGSYMLSDAASADYMRSLAPQAAPKDDSGLDVIGDEPADNIYGSSSLMADNRASLEHDETLGAGIPSADDTGFFTLPDEGPDDLEVLLEQSNSKPKMRHRKLLIVIIVIIVLIAAVFVLYWQGYGYPTQESTINSLFEQHASDIDVLDCWVTTTSEDEVTNIERTMDGVAKTSDITIDYLSQSMLTSEAIVTATLPEGGTIRYEVSLSRDFANIQGVFAWKISDIDFAFKSTNDSTSNSTLSSTTDDEAVEEEVTDDATTTDDASTDETTTEETTTEETTTEEESTDASEEESEQ